MVKPKNDSETGQAESAKERHKKLLKLLKNEIWPHIPRSLLGIRLSKAEEEEILGFVE